MYLVRVSPHPLTWLYIFSCADMFCTTSHTSRAVTAGGQALGLFVFCFVSCLPHQLLLAEVCSCFIFIARGVQGSLSLVSTVKSVCSHELFSFLFVQHFNRILIRTHDFAAECEGTRVNVVARLAGVGSDPCRSMEFALPKRWRIIKANVDIGR